VSVSAHYCYYDYPVLLLTSVGHHGIHGRPGSVSAALQGENCEVKKENTKKEKEMEKTRKMDE
jgi:hypothetical protein